MAMTPLRHKGAGARRVTSSHGQKLRLDQPRDGYGDPEDNALAPESQRRTDHSGVQDQGNIAERQRAAADEGEEGRALQDARLGWAGAKTASREGRRWKR